MNAKRLEWSIQTCAEHAAKEHPFDQRLRLAAFAARLSGHIQEENAPLADLLFALTKTDINHPDTP